MLKISIVDGHHTPESRTTQKGVMWSQEAYAHLGGAYPAKIKLSLDGPQAAYPPGDYQLSPAAFKVGQYGDLEINRFQVKLIPLRSAVQANSQKG